MAKHVCEYFDFVINIMDVKIIDHSDRDNSSKREFSLKYLQSRKFV